MGSHGHCVLDWRGVDGRASVLNKSNDMRRLREQSWDGSGFSSRGCLLPEQQQITIAAAAALRAPLMMSWLGAAPRGAESLGKIPWLHLREPEN